MLRTPIVIAQNTNTEGFASLRRRASSAKALAAAGSGFGAQEAARPKLIRRLLRAEARPELARADANTRFPSNLPSSVLFSRDAALQRPRPAIQSSIRMLKRN